MNGNYIYIYIYIFKLSGFFFWIEEVINEIYRYGVLVGFVSSQRLRNSVRETWPWGKTLKSILWKWESKEEHESLSTAIQIVRSLRMSRYRLSMNVGVEGLMRGKVKSCKSPTVLPIYLFLMTFVLPIYCRQWENSMTCLIQRHFQGP